MQAKQPVLSVPMLWMKHFSSAERVEVARDTMNWIQVCNCSVENIEVQVQGCRQAGATAAHRDCRHTTRLQVLEHVISAKQSIRMYFPWYVITH